MATISCPNCGTTIQTDQALEKHVREQLAQEFGQERTKLLQNEEALKKQLQSLTTRKEEELQQKLKSQAHALREELWAKAQLEAQKVLEKRQSVKVQDLENRLKEEQERATKAEATELELRKKQRLLEEREKQLEIEQEREIDKRMLQERERLSKLETERFSLKEKEYQKQIDDLRQLAAAAQRKAQTVSQQLQGEVQELALEQLLHEAFPDDEIAEVKKGQQGADTVQIVRSRSGKVLGRIVWESKQTEKFSEKWLAKLREDCRAARGDVAVLVSRTLPDDMHVCEQREQVWITDFKFVIPLASLLRQSLLQVDHERQAQSGRGVKSDLLFQYIHSQDFRHRVEAIVESFREMHDDLDREQNSLRLLWKKREKQLLRLATNTAYMYGEIQGLVGASLPGISGLEALEATHVSPNAHRSQQAGEQDALLPE